MTKKVPFFHGKISISLELRKTAASGFHACKLRRNVFHLRLFWTTSRTTHREEGHEISNRAIYKNAVLPKPVLLPMLKIGPILLKFGMIVFKTFVQKTVDQISNLLLRNRDFGAESSRNLSFCKILNKFISFTPPTHHKRRIGPKTIQRRVYKLHPKKIDQI